MADCPRCDTYIKVLRCKAVSITYGIYTLEREIELEDYEMDRYTFCCPECHVELCFDKETARTILKGGTQEWPKK